MHEDKCKYAHTMHFEWEAASSKHNPGFDTSLRVLDNPEAQGRRSNFFQKNPTFSISLKLVLASAKSLFIHLEKDPIF